MKCGSIIFLILTLMSCSKDEVNKASSSHLNGKWIEVVTRTDTLSFELLENLAIMNLQRGKEISSGYLLPKSGSGPYNYTISEGKISLNWMLSSNSSYTDYSFNIVEKRLDIGNFYGSSSGEIVTFEKFN